MRTSVLTRVAAAAVLVVALVVPAAAFAAPHVKDRPNPIEQWQVAQAARALIGPYAAAADDGNNALPGVSLSGKPSSFVSSVSYTDFYDIYSIPLAKGERLRVTLSQYGTDPSDTGAFLLGPNTTAFDPFARGVAWSQYLTEYVYPQLLRFGASEDIAGKSEVYSLVVFGEGKYRMSWAKLPAIADGSADVPGVELQAANNSTLDWQTDWSDVYRASNITTGQALSLELTGTVGTDFDLLVYGPDAKTVYYRRSSGGSTVAWSENAIDSMMTTGYPEQLLFSAPKTGDYYVQVFGFQSTLTGAQPYGLTSTTLPANSLEVTQVAPTGTLPYGSKLTVRGVLSDSADQPFADTAVRIEIYDAAEGGWVPTAIQGSTDAAGAFVLTSPTLGRNTKMRVAYPGEFGAQAPAFSKTIDARVMASFKGSPIAPSSAYTKRAFTVNGYIRPRHKAGGYVVTLYCQRYQYGKWVTRKTVKLTAHDYSSYTRYSGLVSLPYPGKWRIKAYHSDADHAPTWSGYDWITVRNP